jgi:hypothetical protein
MEQRDPRGVSGHFAEVRPRRENGGAAGRRFVRRVGGSAAAARRGRLAVGGLMAVVTLSGCAAAIGAAVAVGEIRQGIAGVQQLLAGSRSLRAAEVETVRALPTPFAGTYRGFQALGRDTVQYFIRTTREPAAPLVDANGNIMGYALPGVAAVTLDTLEARVRQWTEAGQVPNGRALFIVEGTQEPEPNARSLYPAAFIGRVGRGESPTADRHDAELRRLEVSMDAPGVRDLEGRGLPHELFAPVAEGIFTVRPGGEVAFRQEYRTEDGRMLVMSFERISTTTLPADD